jgi:hypothetical protein
MQELSWYVTAYKILRQCFYVNVNFTAMLLYKFKPHSDNILGKYLADLRNVRSVIHQLYIFRLLLNTCWKFNVDVCKCLCISHRLAVL